MKLPKFSLGANVSVLVFAVIIFLILFLLDIALNTVLTRAIVASVHPVAGTSTPIQIELALPVAAVQAVAVTQVKPAPPQTYKRLVRRGDTLTKISRESCNSIDDIVAVKENHISDPDVIREFSILVLKKVEQCSPVLTKSKTSPGNIRASKRGAFREKSFSSASASKAPTHTDVYIAAIPPFDANNCDTLGQRIKGEVKRILLRAKCIEKRFGKFIREAASANPTVTVSEIIAIILVESKGYAWAVSKATKPCYGLMQLKKATARGYGVELIFDPRENILGGTRVYADYKSMFGGKRAHGLAAYNNGPYSKFFKQAEPDPSILDYVKKVEFTLAALK